MALYDWATQLTEGLAPAVDQLDGAVNTTLWADVSTVGGDLALSASISTIGPALSQRIVIVPNTGSADGQGIYIDSVSGDFVYSVRVAESRERPMGSTSADWYVGVGFTDGAYVSSSITYLGGVEYDVDDARSNLWGYGICSGASGNHFDDYTATNTVAGTYHTHFDIILQRVSTTLTIWGSRISLCGIGEPLHKFASVTVGSGAGLIVVRVEASATTQANRAYVDAFARTAGIPR